MERKLAAIFSADMKGYSRLMGDDEIATVRTLTAYQEVMTTLIHTHRGRVVDSPGDNMLAEFASVVDAVQCATEIQHELTVRNAELPVHRQMAFRIGINVGDVLTENGRLYGDGVNIAARLEGLADAGGICISEAAYAQVKNKMALGYEYIGEQSVKNIAEPVRAYKVQMKPDAAATPTTTQEQPAQRLVAAKPTSRYGLQAALTVAVLLVVGVGGMVLRHFYVPPSLPPTQAPIKATPSLSLPDKPSIVVLPFDNVSKDPEQDYFSNGITEVLTSDLSRISSLFVIARNTAFTYKGKAVNMQDIRKELGVRYVLEGRVQKAGEQVRIVAQLIDNNTSSHIWSERYDRPLKDIFALQDEVVQKILTTLKLQLTVQEQGHLVRKRTDNPEAYDAFLRGVDYAFRRTKETSAQARQLFEKAIELDPQYAEAYALLGRTHLIEWVFQWTQDPQALQRAFELEQKALALDDSLPIAHARLGQAYGYNQQYEQAIAEGQRAIALDPNNAESYVIQADVLNSAGRPEEALRMMEQAMRLNPRYPPWYLSTLGIAYNLTGRSAEAIATMKELSSRSPTDLAVYFLLAVSYVRQWAFQQNVADAQTLEQALATVQRVLALNDSYSFGHVILGVVYLYQKQYELVIAEVERAITLDPNNMADNYAFLAEVLSRVGRPEEAVRMVEQTLRRKPFVADQHLESVGFAYYLAGRPEEAIAPLKQYLSRYPNILGAHLTLAAVYSKLGKETEAQAEAAEVLRINPKFSLEVHKERSPIKDPAMLERHIVALRKAGLR